MEVNPSETLASGDLCDELQAALPTYTVSVLAAAATMPSYSARFDVSLADNKGALNKVSSVFAAQHLAVSSLSTEQCLAPVTNTVLFSMRGVVSSSQPIDSEAINAELQKLAESDGIEVDF